MPAVLGKTMAVDGEGAAGPAPVALDFFGRFHAGPRSGTLFAGRLAYCPAARPSERHGGLAHFDDWPAPILTLLVEDQWYEGYEASVIAAVPDGAGTRRDVITIAAGRAGGGRAELVFTGRSHGSGDGLMLPTRDALLAMAERRLTLHDRRGAPSFATLRFDAPQ